MCHALSIQIINAGKYKADQFLIRTKQWRNTIAIEVGISVIKQQGKDVQRCKVYTS